MFNSQKINTDPLPHVGWDQRVGGERRSATPFGYSTALPRPEFDNNPNPILEGFRIDTIEQEVSAGKNAEAWIEGAQEDFYKELDYDPEHIEHAFKVLARLSAL